jgi:hypothetical protein
VITGEAGLGITSSLAPLLCPSRLFFEAGEINFTLDLYLEPTQNNISTGPMFRNLKFLLNLNTSKVSVMDLFLATVFKFNLFFFIESHLNNLKRNKHASIVDKISYRISRIQ